MSTQNIKRIILVDDDKHLLESLKRVLLCDSYEILTFINPVEADEYIDAVNGEIDVVVSDNQMPGVKGTDFLISLRNKYPDIIRIMLTGESSVLDAQSAINEGEVYRFLIKPVDSYDLELVVKRALAHKDLWCDNKMLLEKIKKQDIVFSELEKENPGITKVNRDKDGCIILEEPYAYESFDEYMKRYFKD